MHSTGNRSIRPDRAQGAHQHEAKEHRRAFEAMMPMKKIDIGTIKAARRG